MWTITAEENAMRRMITLSLSLNIAVLVPICLGLALDTGWVARAYGESTQARGILLSIYLAIAVLSLVLLIRPNRRMTAALLLVQVLYKVTTPFTVGTLQNPVVISNLAITVVHIATLVLIFRESRTAPSPTRLAA
ncbi:MAG: hypothetical protein MUE36_08650 [Acidimicrobiales bacterium]|nr:hypothetical protein [Acidimicrobiales bacterium]